MIEAVAVTSLLLLLGSLANGDHSLHQERHNRMIPDYQPFQHPAKMIGHSENSQKGSKLQGAENLLFFSLLNKVLLQRSY